jgi:YVTN family beta-propeller protein
VLADRALADTIGSSSERYYGVIPGQFESLARVSSPTRPANTLDVAVHARVRRDRTGTGSVAGSGDIDVIDAATGQKTATIPTGGVGNAPRKITVPP